MKKDTRAASKSMKAVENDILERISDAYVALDSEWCYTYVNKKAGEIFGRSPESLIGKHIWTEFPEGIGQPFYHKYHEAVETQEPQYLEEFYSPWNKWFANRIYPNKNGLSIYFTDITSTRKSEEAILEQITEAYVYLDKDDCYLYLNERAEQIMGRSADELIGENMWVAFPESVGQPFYHAYIDALESNEYRYIQQYFEPWDKWFETHIYIGIDSRTVLFSDITEKKKAEQAIIEANQRLSLLEKFVANSNDGFQVAREDGTLIYVNEEASQRLGISLVDVQNYKVTDFETLIESEADWNKHVDQLKKVKKLIFFGENRNQKTGKVFPVEVTVNYEFIDGSGYIIAISRDISERLEAEKEIITGKNLNEKIIQSMNDGFIRIDLKGVHQEVNQAFCNMTGFTADELIGTGMPHPYWPKDKAEGYLENYKNSKDQHLQESQIWLARKNGVEFPAIISPSYVYDDEGNIVSIISTIKDISERYIIEQQIQESEERLRAVLEFSELGIWDYNIKHNRTIRSLRHDQCFGYNSLQKDWNREKFMKHVHPDDKEHVEMHEQLVLKEGREYRVEYRVIWPDGSVHWLFAAGNLIKDAVGNFERILGIVEDITKRKEVELQIRDSIKEKETLLAEIHHRVKNNLAVVSGLMQLQTYETENEEVKERLNTSINRIKSIALIHEELYKSHNFANISMKTNIEELVANIASVSDPKDKIELSLDLQDIMLDINQALPCALIVNEIVTNSYKHAFNGTDNGKLGISAKKENESVILQVRDNGKGLPKDFAPNASVSMGFNLIHSLAEQLDGKIEYHNEAGLVVTLSFVNI